MVAKNRKRGRTANNRFPKMLPKRRTFGKRNIWLQIQIKKYLKHGN